ncbi:IS66 family transposase [Paracoccus ravus]|uniref:IS66 family transposase n=1 Tax=Paracoccus ravus TaxID=2447760 RepID=UPI001431DF89|nr:transposase [Paracoccus ravus]
MRLYAVEKDARNTSPDERLGLQQARAKPTFEELEIWLQQQMSKISGKTKLAEAIRCALGPRREATSKMANRVESVRSSVYD